MASEDPFSSDQPGFSSSTGVAPKMELINEFRFTVSPLAKSPGFGFPAASFRFGVADWLELRWRAPEMILTRGADQKNKAHYALNLADPWLGFKVGKRWSPELAISSVIELSLPLGTGGQEAGRAGWYVDLNVDWNIHPRFTITPNMLLASEWSGPRDTGARRMAAALSLAGGWQFSPKVGAFTQLYSWFRNRQERNLQWGLGVVWRVRSFAQLDASINLPIVEGGEPAIVGVGTTIHWAGIKAARSRHRRDLPAPSANSPYRRR